MLSSNDNNNSNSNSKEVHVEVILSPSADAEAAISSNDDENSISYSQIRQHVKKLLISIMSSSKNDPNLLFKDHSTIDFSSCDFLVTCGCQEISIVDSSLPSTLSIDFDSPSPTSPLLPDFKIYIFSLSDIPAEMDSLSLYSQDADENHENLISTLTLPHISTHKIWPSLILPYPTKEHLLSYAKTSLLFAQKKVDQNLIVFNRIILLHGAPGTGKTSLCKALAHKLSIRMSMSNMMNGDDDDGKGQRQHHHYASYPNGTLLITLQSHSLFSKYFSESGKLVGNVLNKIRDLVIDEQDQTLICVLVDEVESLASCRESNTSSGSSSSSGAVESDAIRAVNALLTGLDQLQQYPNVLVLTTTNLLNKGKKSKRAGAIGSGTTGAVDSAFIDRVDMKIHVGLPILQARYEILRSCIEELVRVGIVQYGDDHDVAIVSYSEFIQYAHSIGALKRNHHDDQSNNSNNDDDDDCDCEYTIDPNVLLKSEENRSNTNSNNNRKKQNEILWSFWKICQNSKDLSGRTLRKLPFQACAFASLSSTTTISKHSLLSILSSLHNVIKQEQESR